MDCYIMIKPDGMNATIPSDTLLAFLYAFANYLNGTEVFGIPQKYSESYRQSVKHAKERENSEESFKGSISLPDGSITKIQQLNIKHEKLDFRKGLELSFKVFSIKWIKLKEKSLTDKDIRRIYGKESEQVLALLTEYLLDQNVCFYKVDCEGVYWLNHMKVFIRHFFGNSNYGYQLKNLIHVFDQNETDLLKDILKEE